MKNFPVRKNTRIKSFDYSSKCAYFITFCTKDRINYFSNIIDWVNNLNQLWLIVKNEIVLTNILRKNIEIDEFIIMPNHVHLIIFVGNDCIVPENKNFSRQNEIIPSIIKWLKSSITSKINKYQKDFYFSWQKSYYDRVIRNEIELDKIRQYIIDNPLKWDINNQEENLYM